MFKTFWILAFSTIIFICISNSLTAGGEEPVKKSSGKYQFIAQITENGKLTAVMLAKEKKENFGGQQLILKDVEFYFPSPKKSEEMGKVELKDLKEYAKKNTLEVKVWSGDLMTLDMKQKGVQTKFSASDLQSFVWKGKVRLDMGFGAERKTLLGEDVSLKDGILTLPKPFVWKSSTYSIKGANAKLKFKPEVRNIKKERDETKEAFNQEVINQFEDVQISGPILINSKKDKPHSVLKMKLKKGLKGKLTKDNKFSFVSKGTMEAFVETETRDLFVTGDSVQGTLSNNQEVFGLEYLEIDEPWCRVKEFVIENKKKNKEKIKFSMNMSGRKFRMFSDGYEMTGQPVSIWNSEMGGHVSHVSYKVDKITKKGVFKFKNPDIDIDQEGIKQVQRKAAEEKKHEETVK
jgi:hypothetical protein